MQLSDYRIAGNFDGGKYWRIGFIEKFDGEILTDSLLGNLYLLYKLENWKGKFWRIAS